MATNLNNTHNIAAAYGAVHRVDRNAKSPNTEGSSAHAHRTTSPNAAPASSTDRIKSQWPILDLMNPQPYSGHERAGPGHKTTTDNANSTCDPCTEDIDLSDNPEASRNIDLYGYNIPQSIVAKPRANHRDMRPMERMLAETYTSRQSKTNAKQT